MRSKGLNSLFHLGLFILTIGTLFKIQHWPYGAFIQYIGVVLEGLFFFFVALEILLSKKASVGNKAVFSLVYLLVPILAYSYLPALVLIFAIFVAGTAYLRAFRKRFMFIRE